MRTPLRFHSGRSLSAGILLAACLHSMGCGNAGPTLYPLSGEVKYQGKSVKAGMIQFMPAGDKIDSRGIVIAEIRDGRYELPKKKGVIGGPYIVIISPTDGNPQDEQPLGRAVFSVPYETKVELAKEPATKDFDIPPQKGAKL